MEQKLNVNAFAMDMATLKLFLRQPVNFWKSLTLPTRIQHGALVLLIYIFAIDRLYRLVALLLRQRAWYAGSLVWLALDLFLFSLLLSAPYILQRIISLQPVFSTLCTMPVSVRQLRAILFYYTHKYWLVLWAVFLMVPISLLGLKPLWALILLALFLLADVLSFYFAVIWLFNGSRKRRYYFLAPLMAAVLAVLFFVLRQTPHYLLLANGLLLLGLFVAIRVLGGVEIGPDAEQRLPGLRMPSVRRHRSVTISGGALKSLFLRDWLNHWRNSAYLKNKILLLAMVVFFGAIAFYSYPLKKALPAFSGFWFLLIWWHYSAVFSHRYGRSEPEWFFRQVPLPFLAYVAAVFLNEFVFVMLMLVFYSIVLIAAGIGFSSQWQWLLLLVFFSAVVLLTMITFRVLFYDDLPAGGYAYHFSLIFFTVMSLNYYFVGPVLTILFILIYVYKSYRFLKG